MKKKNIIIVAIAIVVVLIAGFLGWYLAMRETNKTNIVNGIVVNVRNNVDYKTTMITTYEEYKDILNQNNILLDSEDKTFLTEEDFKKYDYIVDYIPYEKKLNVLKINVDLLEGGTVITYTLNKEVESNTELLLYVIPLDKGQISEFNLASRNFTYED